MQIQIFYLCTMNTDYQIAEPILFNPLKHHLGFIKEYLELNIDAPDTDENILLKELKHIGTSVMDVYTGSLTVKDICHETLEFLRFKNVFTIEGIQSMDC